METGGGGQSKLDKRISHHLPGFYIPGGGVRQGSPSCIKFAEALSTLMGGYEERYSACSPPEERTLPLRVLKLPTDDYFSTHDPM